MKANELMIGDWVFVPHNGSATHYGHVCSIYEGEVVSTTLEKDSGLTKASALKPIPLTAEILEKNGFIGKEEGHYYSYHIRYGRLANEIFNVHYQNHWIACSTPDNRDEFALFGIIILRYVHELQHALRLCGLDKLADNFKI